MLRSRCVEKAVRTVDPVLTSLAVGSASQLLANGISRVVRLVSSGAELSPDWQLHYPVLTESDEVVAVLTPDQARRLNSFLSDRPVRVLAEVRALAQLVIENSSTFRVITASLKADFLTLGSNEPSMDIDAATLDLVWDRFEQQVSALYVDADFVGQLDVDEKTALEASQVPLDIDRPARAKVPRWLRELIDLAGQLDRLEAADALARDVREAGLADFEELRMDHALEEVRRPLHSLYVHRSLQGPDGESRTTEDVFTDRYRSRIVVTGAPGAGKSTLTQHLLYSVSSTPAETSVPLRVRVREIDHDTDILVDEIAAAVRRDFQLSDVSTECLEDLLVLGRALVVFDGVDEVLALASRKRFISKIEAFSRRYPMCSVLVTSRDVGYDQASLTDGLFTRYRLVPFTDEQVAEYAGKWFGADPADRDLPSSFLRDLDPVPDLRENPLMLSLLCTLYKARGHIPRNRRHVYTTCADLLFNRWDSLRQIDQPVDHIDHGQDLMQDVALFFFKSETAQRGIEEAQLRAIIATFLRDSAGVLPAAANHRAKAFLDFCAGRAWLLGYAGTSPAGERLFVFTHRTFMEFFAAEGLVRTTSSPAELAATMCQAFDANASSVLPELIIAAAESSRRGAARDILKCVKEKEHLIAGRGIGRYLPLRLRVATVLTLQPHILDPIILDALDYLRQRDFGADLAVLNSMLDLPRDPQARIAAHLTDPREVSSEASPMELRLRQQAFIRAWAFKEARGEVSVYRGEWGDVVDLVWELLTDDGTSVQDEFVRFYTLRFRRHPMTLQQADLRWLVTFPPAYYFPGVPFETFRRLLLGRAFDDVDVSVAEFMRATTVTAELSWREGSEIVHWLATVLESPGALAAPDRIAPEFASVVAGFALIYCEVVGPKAPHIASLSQLLSVDLSHLVLTRARSLGSRAGQGRRMSAAALSALGSRLGPAVETWARGNLHYVAADTSPRDEQ